MKRIETLHKLPGGVGNYWNRPLGSKLIILGAAAFLLELLAPWQRICAVTADPGSRICGWRTGYEGSDFGTYAAFSAGAILVWELLPVIAPRLSMRGWPAAIITAVLGVALAIATLVKVIKDNEFQTIWAWLGLALALAVMLIGLIRVRYRWRIRGDDHPPAPEPAPPDTPRADVH
jgi:hypothetical protein